MDNQIKKSNIWEMIDKFDSILEFKRFELWIEQQLLADSATEIPVKAFFASQNLRERWFINNNGECWRLVYPDPPFCGYWGKVIE